MSRGHNLTFPSSFGIDLVLARLAQGLRSVWNLLAISWI